MKKLKDVIDYLDMPNHCRVWVSDFFVDSNDEEKVFEGAVMDIPWYLLNYYLDNSGEAGAIASYGYVNEHDVVVSGFDIYLREKALCSKEVEAN